jgi:hypothetical protein
MSFVSLPGDSCSEHVARKASIIALDWSSRPDVILSLYLIWPNILAISNDWQICVHAHGVCARPQQRLPPASPDDFFLLSKASETKLHCSHHRVLRQQQHASTCCFDNSKHAELILPFQLMHSNFSACMCLRRCCVGPADPVTAALPRFMSICHDVEVKITCTLKSRRQGSGVR